MKTPQFVKSGVKKVTVPAMHLGVGLLTKRMISKSRNPAEVALLGAAVTAIVVAIHKHEAKANKVA